MKTFVPDVKLFKNLPVVILLLHLVISSEAQTYTTISNGSWSSASTWQGGNIPNASNIPSAAIINIKHIVTYSGGNISNNGTINIGTTSGMCPRLLIAAGVTFTNQSTGKIYIKDGEYRQCRFVGGGETGVPQAGSLINAGGYMLVINSFVEVANEWKNQNNGSRYIKNSSVAVGTNFLQSSNGTDSLVYASISVGAQGTGDFTISGSNIYFDMTRIEIANLTGGFKLSGCIAEGNIDYITLKNHVTGLYSTGLIEIKNSVTTTGININAYCALTPASYITNGKTTGPQDLNCSLNYFPAKLFASVTPGALNFSTSPLLISGVDKQLGATYKYEGIAPGIDAIVKIDSLVNGATIVTIDDNTGGLGFIEGFQPEIKAGPSVGESYAVFTMTYKITGTNVDYPLATFNITAVDIDGNNQLKEFDQIIVAPGAVANYLVGTTDILLTEIAPGSFKGINIAGIERSGIDTNAKANMFTVSATNLSTVTLKLGTVKTNTTQSSRQYGIYFKGFVYPNITTLPVKMESFTATLNKEGTKVNLNWVTAAELNVSHFIIERSTDGLNYNDAGLVFASGNSNTSIDYLFTDNINNIQSAILYYRLKIVDQDGKSDYSQIRIIRISKETGSIVKILTYPNPVSNELRISIPAEWQNKKVVYELFQANGQVAKRIESANSSQTETMNVSQLSSGFYFVRVTCNGEIATQKIIKH